MIRITNPEYIDGKDDFKIDGLHIKKFSLEGNFVRSYKFCSKSNSLEVS